MRVKTSKHPTKFSNSRKKQNLTDFVSEYRRIASIIINDIWENGYSWEIQGKTKLFSIQENSLDFPSFLDYKKFGINTTLTARALSSLVTQLVAIMKSSTEKQRKRLYQLGKFKQDGVSRSKLKLLIRKIKQNIPQKPNVSGLNPELSSKCVDFMETTGEFGGYLRLKSILKSKITIKIPVKWHKHSNLLKEKGEMMNSFLISTKYINVRWKLPDVPKKTKGITVGADQGVKDLLTFSNDTRTKHECPHGHSVESVLRKLSRKKKGSKAFRRAQAHRTNIINWSINQLNFKEIKEVRLEKIWNIGYKQKTHRVLSHWTNTIIRDKVESVCESEGVLLIHQSCTYRSQRCSDCGIVRKANRKGKIYSCKHCGNTLDADLNASKNHEYNIPEIPWTFRGRKFNLGNGFYWLKSGFYKFSDGSIESPSNLLKL